MQSCDSATGSAPSIAQVFAAQAKLSAKPSKRPLPHKRPPDAERLAPRPFDIDEQTFLQVARAYVCNTKSGANANREEIAYTEARQYFEAQHWEEAGTLFHDIAVGAPSDVAIYAAQLSLEAFNVLATKFNRPDCYETLAAHLDEYIARLCTRTDANDGEQCKTLKTVKEDLQKLRR